MDSVEGHDPGYDRSSPARNPGPRRRRHTQSPKGPHRHPEGPGDLRFSEESDETRREECVRDGVCSRALDLVGGRGLKGSDPGTVPTETIPTSVYERLQGREGGWVRPLVPDTLGSRGRLGHVCNHVYPRVQ